VNVNVALRPKCAHVKVILLYAAFMVLDLQRAVKHPHVVEECEPFLGCRTDQADFADLRMQEWGFSGNDYAGVSA